MQCSPRRRLDEVLRTLATVATTVMIVAGCGSSAASGVGRTPPHRTASTVSPRDGVYAAGDTLMRDGSPWQAVGVDDYRLTSDGVDQGCDDALSSADVEVAFASIPSGSVVRTWAWQGVLASKVSPHATDWGALDRVVAAAGRHHDALILSLAPQDGTCDGGAWHGPDWYEGGYATTPQGGGLSYEAWVRAVVGRYRSNRAVAMWEPVNEPEASTCGAGFSGHGCYGHQSCPSEPAATAALRSFFDVIGGLIHGLDPDAMVESGTIGTGQCGTAGADYATVGTSPGLDVLSLHDYSDPTAVLAGDAYNGQRVRIAQARQIAKPLIAGEIGVEGSQGLSGGCPTDAQRAVDLRAKVQADLAGGMAGALVWDLQPAQPAGCSYELAPGDPYLPGS